MFIAGLMGMPAGNLVPEEARPAVLSIVQQVQQGQTVTAETTNQRRDCTIFPVRVIAAPDPADAGRMLVTVEDITTEVQRRSEAEAIDAERRRIAHEIHDGVAQSLAGLRFKSALWQHLADAAPLACALRWKSCRPCSMAPSPTSAAPSSPCARWTWRRWASSLRWRNWWTTSATRTNWLPNWMCQNRMTPYPQSTNCRCSASSGKV